ncbi:MAG: hypothetical protein WD226_13740, partial [Planctomycetota bacterium]
MRQKFFSTALYLVLTALVSLVPQLASAAAPASARQDGTVVDDRELAGLIEEQSNLIRQLTRLRGTMEVLLDRIQAEGRTRTATLLGDALRRLDAREAEDTLDEELTLAERMERARTAMQEGRLVQSIERQSKLVGELEGLLDILLDRQSLERLEDELDRLRERRERVAELSSREAELRRRTKELRDRAANDAQRELERSLDELARQEGERLRASEAEARASGAFELEALERELSQVLADQRIDEDVLAGWQPARDEAWREAGAAAARAAERLAERRRETSTAAELEAAAEAIAEGRRGAAEVARELEDAAGAARRDARVSPTPSRDAEATALERAVRAAGDGERGASTPEETAGALRAAAEELRARAEAGAQAVEADLAAAADAARELAAGEPNEADRQLAEDLARGFERASAARAAGEEEAADLATKNSAIALERAVAEREFLAEALAGSQAEQAARTERLERALDSLPERATDAEARNDAREALQRAAEAMRRASSQARNQAAEPGREAAAEAREALEAALGELASGASERQQAGREAMQQMAAAEAQAARTAEALRESLE